MIILNEKVIKMEKMKSKETRNSILVILCGFVGVNLWQIIAHVISTVVYVKITGSRDLAKLAVQKNEVLTNIFNIGMEIVLIGVVYYFVKKVENNQSFLSSLDMDRRGNSLREFLKGVAIVIAINVPFWIIADMVHWVNIKSSGFSEFSPLHVIGYTVIMGIVTLFPGVCEEIFFRGYLQKRLMGWKGPWFSLVTTSLIFMIFHIGRYNNLTTLVYLFVIGMLLGYLYYKSGSLYITIGFHYSWDFLASAFAEGHTPSLFMIKIVNQTSITILYTIILAITFLIVFYKKRNPSVRVNQNKAY
jgi:uncharacterized protein